MKRIILIDGNNLLFRSYYATAYTGNIMKNSKGFPTNALYGFINMMNKIIKEENPNYIVVAFDKGKTFRHDKYETYKEGRIEMPDDLRLQFPASKELLNHMGIKYIEVDNYEADDIIGTLSKEAEKDPFFIATIISSDKDLLQLISPQVEVKLLKQKDYIRMNEDVFFDTYGISPIKMIDLKALAGDSSDNIPGVKGIGEVSALKLLKEYGSLDGIYENIDNIKGKIKDKLIESKKEAYMSFDLATIYNSVPLDLDLNQYSYDAKKEKTDELIMMLNDLEFYSLLKDEKEKKQEDEILDVKIINNIEELPQIEKSAYFLELFGTNYHTAKIIGMGVFNEKNSFFINGNILEEALKKIGDNLAYTYDIKKNIVSFKWNEIILPNTDFDLMIASYLLNENIKDDIAFLINNQNLKIPFYDDLYKKKTYDELDINYIASVAVLKAKFIYENKDNYQNKIISENMDNLFYEIEIPLAYTLAEMEHVGVRVDLKLLDKMGDELKIKIEILEREIHNLAGLTFNILSPKQLGDVLFEKLGLPYKKKTKRGYSTDIEVLKKLENTHPIIAKIIEYRTLTKLDSTYIEGLKLNVLSDGKVHTIYNQTLTRTGRLSSVEPNLQNIPIRYEYGRMIRKAFVPSNNNIFMAGDYSQIELRILAHMSRVDSLIEAFRKGLDIHTKTAMDIFHVDEIAVTKNMRRTAKAVNFGIVYGISGFGLSENLDIDVREAKKFIDEYLSTYPGIKNYMDSVIKKAHEEGFVTTIMNRKRVIPELENKNYMIRQMGERMALNTPIQGSSADIIKKAMVDITNEFNQKKIKSKMILQVHDELIFDCLPEEKEIVEKIVKDIMENTYKIDVPISVEIEFGNNWYEV